MNDNQKEEYRNIENKYKEEIKNLTKSIEAYEVGFDGDTKKMIDILKFNNIESLNDLKDQIESENKKLLKNLEQEYEESIVTEKKK